MNLTMNYKGLTAMELVVQVVGITFEFKIGLLLSKSEIVKILLMQLVALCLTIKLVILSLSTKWNGKIYVTKWISKGILPICLILLTWQFNEYQWIASET